MVIKYSKQHEINLQLLIKAVALYKIKLLEKRSQFVYEEMDEGSCLDK